MSRHAASSPMFSLAATIADDNVVKAFFRRLGDIQHVQSHDADPG